jgi:glycerol-3-phosphate dehydrogenase subunit C
MPLLEQGHLDDVISRARAVAPALAGLGTVVALTPSCTLMLKSEWPALLPDDGCVRDLADRTTDLMRYISDVAALSSKPIRMSLPEDISMHMACHVRAQNQGNASYELLSKLSASPITLIERCSGHGGMWGYKKEHFQEALAVGKPVIRQAASVGARIVTSECPMAAKHLQQQARLMGHRDVWVIHPVVLLAMAVDPSFFKAGETFVPAPSFSIGEPVHG